MFHFDARAAYVNATMPNDVFIAQPPGFSRGQSPSYVLKLLRALYGLAESGYLWSQLFHAVIAAYGFQRIANDECVYFMHRAGKSSLFCGLYTDDLFLVTDDNEECEKFFKFLSSHYDFHNLGPLQSALGVTFTQVPAEGLYAMDQGAYIEDYLREMQMENCRIAAVPMRDSWNYISLIR
jgi:hypothetical protein